jgi:hypothetical protein
MNFYLMAALGVGCIGVIHSIILYRKNRNAELRFKALLRQHASELQFIGEIGRLHDHTTYKRRVISFEEFLRVQYALKLLLLHLPKADRNEILEPLEQRHVYNQVRYINKFMHLLGFDESLVLQA